MSIASKLQLKDGETVRFVNAPEGLDLGPSTASSEADAVLVFVRNKAELAKHEQTALDHAADDRLTWIAYPKAGRLETDLEPRHPPGAPRRQGRAAGPTGALDETWSALRFRPAPWSFGPDD